MAAIGVANGAIDHPIYLLPGLHLADPGFLSADWFVAEAAHSHKVYAVLVAAIARLGPLEPGLAVAAVLQSIVVALGTWLLARHLYDEPLLPWAMALMLVGATHARGVGLSWLIVPQFVAASVAGAATVLGLGLLAARRRSGFAGLAFGVAALIHVNFAVLLTPIVGAATGLMLHRRDWRRGLATLSIFALLALPSYVQVARHLMAADQGSAGEIIVRRYPHHFDPTTWGPAQGLLLVAVVMAGAVAYLIRRPRRRDPLFAAVGTMTAMVLVALMIGYGDLSGTVNQLFVWRLSSVVVLLTALMVSAAVTAPPALTDRARWFATGAITVLALSALGAIAVGGAARRVGAALAVVALIAVLCGWARPPLRAGKRSATASTDRTRLALAAVLVGFVPTAWQGLAESHIGFRVSPESRAALYEWARTHSPENALFAVPPGWADFRLIARRAIVAHKSPPIESDDMFEWVDRLEALTGLPPQVEFARLDSAYLQSDCVRIARLKERYGIDFAVRRSTSAPCGQVVFSEGEFEVVVPGRVDDPDPAPGATAAP